MDGILAAREAVAGDLVAGRSALQHEAGVPPGPDDGVPCDYAVRHGDQVDAAVVVAPIADACVLDDVALEVKPVA